MFKNNIYNFFFIKISFYTVFLFCYITFHWTLDIILFLSYYILVISSSLEIVLKLFSSNFDHPKILSSFEATDNHCWNRCDSRIGRFMRFLEKSHVRHQSSQISSVNPCSIIEPVLFQFRILMKYDRIESNIYVLFNYYYLMFNSFSRRIEIIISFKKLLGNVL